MYKNTKELEHEIIGIFIINDGTHTFINELKEEMFTIEQPKRIFKAMVELKEQDKMISPLSITSLTGISVSAITSDFIAIPKTTGVTYTKTLIEILHNNYTQKLIGIKAEAIYKKSQKRGINGADLRDEAIKELQELEIIQQEDGTILIGDALEQAIAEIDYGVNNEDDKAFYTGFPKLDDFMAGLHPQQLTTVGARTGVGKTLFALQVALKIAKNNKSVLFVTREMSPSQLAERVLLMNTPITSENMRKRQNIGKEEYAHMFRVRQEFEKLSFRIDNKSRTSIDIERVVRKHKPDLVIVDYLQLLESPDKGDSREREVAKMARGLKTMTLEYNIPIMMLSQLNRDSEHNNTPKLRHLRESGAIEQDSDNVILIHEPDLDEAEKVAERLNLNHNFIDDITKKGMSLVQLIIAKQRNGPLATINMVKEGAKYRMLELELVKGS